MPAEQTPGAAQSASFPQEVGHVALVVLHRYGAQAGVPARPGGRKLQRPTAPLRLHASQAPPQRPSQQTPSVQKPEAQSWSAAQGRAAGNGGTQAPAMQASRAAQSAEVVHRVGQLSAALSQR